MATSTSFGQRCKDEPAHAHGCSSSGFTGGVSESCRAYGCARITAATRDCAAYCAWRQQSYRTSYAVEREPDPGNARRIVRNSTCEVGGTHTAGICSDCYPAAPCKLKSADDGRFCTSACVRSDDALWTSACTGG